MKYSILLLFLLVALSGVFAQSPPSSNAVMKKAYHQAAIENKKLFVIFHASWCGWCKKMEKSMDDSTCKSSFDNNFVIVHLDVDETDDKKKLENPGADSMRNSYSGKDQGLPYWLIFDQKGKLQADSRNRKDTDGPAASNNVGCPATAEEVAFFISVLKKTTNLSEYQLDVIQKRFRQNEN